MICAHTSFVIIDEDKINKSFLNEYTGQEILLFLAKINDDPSKNSI